MFFCFLLCSLFFYEHFFFRVHWKAKLQWMFLGVMLLLPGVDHAFATSRHPQCLVDHGGDMKDLMLMGPSRARFCAHALCKKKKNPWHVFKNKKLPTCSLFPDAFFPAVLPFQMVVSWNRVTLKSSILMGFSTINHPFWGTPMAVETPKYLRPLAKKHQFRPRSWQAPVDPWRLAATRRQGALVVTPWGMGNGQAERF